MLSRYQIEQALFKQHYVFVDNIEDMRVAGHLVAHYGIVRRSKPQAISMLLESRKVLNLPSYVVSELRAMLAEALL